MPDGQFQLVLVTPEKTLLDTPVNNLRYPLFDGLAGIYPSRAPMVGRLGFGQLLIRAPSGEQSFYIDGGFIQVKENVVSILTNDATPLKELDAAALRTELSELVEKVTFDADEQADKMNRVDRVRKMLSLAQ
jgi:F-type H+-transporting ATPase subunit epsilon